MRGEMPEFSDETLLGYLLGGLSEAENARIEAALVDSERLRQRLSDVRGLLEPLAPLEEAFEPRADLVSETMALIGSCEAPTFSDNRLTEWQQAPMATRIAWLDSLVALAAGIIFLSFLLPTVWQWRESARRVTCADNLKNLGVALVSYPAVTAKREFPSIDVVSPFNFAGVYPIRLNDYQLLDSVRWLYCPSSRPIPLAMRIPTSKEFLVAPPEQQRLWKYVVGGSYAYHLGSIVEGSYQPPSVDAPVRFALLGDMWPTNFGAVDEANEPIRLHGDQAVNILYDDGSVRLIRIPSRSDAGFDGANAIDNPFLNRALEQGVGIGEYDACLGPSYWVPAVDVDRAR
jgi:hypothetical protein